METDRTVTYQKNHDLKSEAKIKDDRQYLVYIRYPLESLTSYFDLEVKTRLHSNSKAWWEKTAKKNMQC